MSAFNTSTRKEDLSVKLRAHNIRQARDQTKRLEEESQKMEERLRELKTAMTREKEDREKKGGGFWGRGQQNVGSLTSYASEVLQSKSDKLPKDTKKKKIKVLQDEPLDVPKRSSQPGTMKNIAQRKLPTGITPRGDKLRGGPKCGQCEDRTATLTCVQCSEIFCFGCFSAFHLKGALKQHRSVPLSATGSRICMSPRTGSEPQSSHDSQASGSIPTYSISLHNESGAAQASPLPPSDSSLLLGNYDESQSAASFQQALMAWRQGEETKAYKPQAFSPRQSSSSPQKTPVMTLDESIGTTEQPRVPEIKFKSTLSYADRLLLKKHRRTELAEMSTPRIGNSSGSGQYEVTPIRQSPLSSTFSAKNNQYSRETSFSSRRLESNLEESDHINFESLLEAVQASETPDHHAASNYSLSPILPDKTDTSRTVSNKVTCLVKEVSPMESWKLENNIDSNSTNQNNTKTNSSKSLGQRNAITELFTPDTDRPSSSMIGGGQPVLSSRHKPKVHMASVSSTPDVIKDDTATEVAGDKALGSSTSRLKSSKASTGKKSRPASRAESRAYSRISIKGTLTKCPNEALKKVAQMTILPQFSYHSPMEGFFLSGVESGDHSQETSRKQSSEDQRSKSTKVSNRLYQMAPRSWRPESSLGDNVPLSDIKLEDNFQALTLAYSYSGQISGQATEWRPSSSQSRVQMSSPDLGVNSSLVFGDEMFTEEASHATMKTPRAPSTPKTGRSSQRLNRVQGADGKVKTITKSTLPSHTNKREIMSSPKGINSEIPTKSSTPQTSNRHNATSAHSANAKTLANKSQDSSKSHSMKIGNSSAATNRQSQALKSVDNPAPLSRQNSQSSEHLNQGPDKNVKNYLRKNSGTPQKIIQVSNSDITQMRSSLISKGSNKPVKNAKNILNKSDSDHRPLSSTNVPKTSQKSSNMRPNSSSGANEPLRKTQPSLNSHKPDNTIIANMMMSRVQEDGWVASQLEDDSGAESDTTIGMDYDDGNDITLTLRNQSEENLKSSLEDNQHWETEVRPFSGISITSKKAGLPSRQRGVKNEKQISSSRPGSSRPVSSRPGSSRPVSIFSGRESRAIIMDGDDLSRYDNVGVTEQQDVEDKQALDQLEWELASDTGRLTADGQISRMSLYESNDDSEPSSRSSNGSVKLNGEQEYDIGAKIFEDERNAEQEVDLLLTRRSLTVDENEVRALR
ncbi:dentin sialophosphoprotein-like isoform X2 [Biomphalaria glabrata]|uniref:Dentin sialophosphoprotein-like isoform X2 n=1 Tax=Biomphalaria glabrata TaxID=6526 RepID=A0A9W2Z1E4_BIOGL|nr:dentin sialophosphoprotein-like isoform X2 [Biomphalaria glabrata]